MKPKKAARAVVVPEDGAEGGVMVVDAKHMTKAASVRLMDRLVPSDKENSDVDMLHRISARLER